MCIRDSFSGVLVCVIVNLVVLFGATQLDQEGSMPLRKASSAAQLSEVICLQYDIFKDHLN